jgi:transglutaminase-like putative cysteine protease
MKSLVLSACRSDPRIRELSLSLSTGFGMCGPVDSARCIESYVRDSYTFVDEPEELLIDPAVQLDMLSAHGTIHGDCDDAAMLAACLLYNIGLETRFKAVSHGPDGSFQHVFTEYRLRTSPRWIPVDPTIEGIPVYPPGDYITEVL